MSKAHALQRIKGGLVYALFLVAYTVAVLMRTRCAATRRSLPVRAAHYAVYYK